MSAEFCDSNIIVYAYDNSAGDKHERARRLVDGLWASHDGFVSIQVLQEVFVTLTRKVARPLSAAQAREIVADLATWPIVVATHADVLDAIDGVMRWQVAFWDAMVITAAGKAGANVLWSEDLNHGQRYGDIVVRNPFRDQS